MILTNSNFYAIIKIINYWGCTIAILPIEVTTKNADKVTQLTNKISLLEKSQDRLKSQNIEYEKQLISLDKKSEDYLKQKEKLTTSIKKNNIAIKENSLELRIYNKELSTTKTESKKAEVAQAKFNKELKKAEALKAKEELSKYNQELKENERQSREAQKAQNKLLQEYKKQEAIKAKESLNRYNEELKRSAKEAKEAQEKTDKFNNALKTLATGILAVVVVDKLTTAFKDLTVHAVTVSAEFERIGTVLNTIEGGADKAEESMQWIKEFATTTPYDIQRVSESFASLRAYGLNPTNGLLRTLGDTASAMGKDLQQAVEAMADAVVGENERLKEFGIRASLMGEEIKYSWTNSSNEGREIVVANNSQIIESTLSAIFNSKYEGAMEMQSKTWNGMISNMNDMWTNFTLDIMNGGLFDYLKAGAMTMSDFMNEGFKTGAEGAEAFSNIAIDGINSVIGALGFMYDWGNGIGLMIDLMITGLGGLLKPLQGTINLVIAGVNAYNSVMGGPQISKVNFADRILAKGISGALENFNQLRNSEGGALAERFNADTNLKFKEIRFSDIEDKTTKVKEDFGNKVNNSKASDNAEITANDIYQGTKFLQDLADKYEAEQKAKKENPIADNFNIQDEIVKQDEYTKTMLENMNTTREVTEATEETTEVKKEFIDTFYNDKDSVYETIQDTTKKADNFSGSLNTLDNGLTKVIDTMDTFIFQFTDTLFNSLKSNADQLGNIGKQTAFNTINYSQALSLAVKAKNDLALNPMDRDIGTIYTEAYNQFVSSATDYLDPSNFSNISEMRFAQSTVGTQAGQFESTAQIASQTLTSMNEFLEAINLANEDGNISEDEQIELQKLALKTQDSNNALLLIGLKNVAGTVDSQTYYDNKGLATDKSLTGETNSVQSVISDLMGDGNKGISINGLLAGAKALSVATGLDVSQLSNLSAIEKSNKVLTNNDTTSLKNLQIKQVNHNKREWTEWDYGKRTEVKHFRESTYYDYFAKGGYTDGIGKKDHTGFKQAGIVHEGEYVAPKWMVDSNPMLFNQMEVARQKGSFADGGFTSQPSFNVSATMGNNSDLAEIRKDIKQLTMILNNVTEGGNLMNVALRA